MRNLGRGRLPAGLQSLLGPLELAAIHYVVCLDAWREVRVERVIRCEWERPPRRCLLAGARSGCAACRAEGRRRATLVELARKTEQALDALERQIQARMTESAVPNPAAFRAGGSSP